MPTYTVGPGKTYSTIQAAINAIPSNIAGTGVHDVRIDAGTYAVSSITVSKSGSSASDYVHIRAASGSEHNGKYTGVIITRSSAASGPILTSALTPYTRTSNLILYSQTVSSDPFSRGDVFYAAANSLNVNIIAIGGGSAYIFNTAGAGGSATYINCIAARNTLAGTRPTIGFYLFSLDKVYNCGCFDCDSGFRVSNGADGYIWNSWAYISSGGSPQGGFIKENAGNTWTTSSNNASSDATAPGANSLINKTLSEFGFVSSSTSNFHITNTSVLFGAGVDLSAIFTLDIDNEFVKRWCIGPDSPPAPDPYQPTSSDPWKGQIEVSDKPSDAKAASLRTIKGSPSPSSNSPSRTSDAKDFKPTLRSSEPTPPVETQKQSGREAEGYVLNGKKGQRTGFISLMPELNGYGAATPGLGTGYLMPFMGETLALGKEFRDLDPVHSSRVNGTRRAMYQSPAGKVEFPVRSNDIVPLLQAHFQKRIGTTAVAGTTYYEFVPNKGRIALSAGQFGTGSYNQADTANAFSISAYKDISGNGILFKSGIIDKLAFKFHSVIEPSIEADFRFREGTLMGTQTSHPYGTYSGNKEFSPTECSVDFMGLPVIDFEFVSDNQVENRSVVGDSRPIHKFGQYRLRGKAVVDLGKTGLRNYGSVLSGSAFSVSATMHQSNHNRLVFDFPDCRISDFPIGYQSIYTIPFEAFASDNGSTAPVKVGVWTQNYSATSFQPY